MISPVSSKSHANSNDDKWRLCVVTVSRADQKIPAADCPCAVPCSAVASVPVASDRVIDVIDCKFVLVTVTGALPISRFSVV